MRSAPDARGAGRRLWWLASTARLSYAQLTAILGAFSLVTVLSHITGAQIRGWLAGLIQSWNRVVRPPTAWALRRLLTVPLHAIFGITVVCPLWIRDYLSTGAVLLVSTFGRSDLQLAVEELRRDLRWNLRFTDSRWSTARAIARAIAAKVVGTLVRLGLSLVFWPLLLLGLIVMYSIRDDEPILIQSPQERRKFLLSLAPLGYFLVFALINVITG